MESFGYGILAIHARVVESMLIILSSSSVTVRLCNVELDSLINLVEGLSLSSLGASSEWR